MAESTIKTVRISQRAGFNGTDITVTNETDVRQQIDLEIDGQRSNFILEPTKERVIRIRISSAPYSPK